jgi:hypothetical protein
VEAGFATGSRGFQPPRDMAAQNSDGYPGPLITGNPSFTAETQRAQREARPEAFAPFASRRSDTGTRQALVGGIQSTCRPARACGGCRCTDHRQSTSAACSNSAAQIPLLRYSIHAARPPTTTAAPTMAEAARSHPDWKEIFMTKTMLKTTSVKTSL